MFEHGKKAQNGLIRLDSMSKCKLRQVLHAFQANHCLSFLHLYRHNRALQPLKKSTLQIALGENMGGFGSGRQGQRDCRGVVLGGHPGGATSTPGTGSLDRDLELVPQREAGRRDRHGILPRLGGFHVPATIPG